MLVGQVEKEKNNTIVYNICLVNAKITLFLNQFYTSSYIVFLKYGLYPKNINKGEDYENSSNLC